MSGPEAQGSLIGQGNTAEVYEWGEGQVLKLYRSGMPADLCAHEFAMTTLAHERLGVAPRPTRMVSVDGRVGGIYERLGGRSMLKLMLSRPWRIRRFSQMLARVHHAIQRPVPTRILTVKQKLERDIDGTSLLSTAEKRLIKERLDALPDGDVLCHFDLHPDNVLLSGSQHHVIDWMTGCIGDPLADVARTALLLNHAEIPRVPRVVSSAARMLQKSICKVYLREYTQLTGTALSEIQRWETPLAAARLCEWIPERESKRLVAMIRADLRRPTDLASLA